MVVQLTVVHLTVVHCIVLQSIVVHCIVLQSIVVQFLMLYVVPVFFVIVFAFKRLLKFKLIILKSVMLNCYRPYNRLNNMLNSMYNRYI